MRKLFHLIEYSFLPWPELMEALAVTQNVFIQVCESMRRLNTTNGQLDALFQSEHLNSLVHAGLRLPAVGTVIFKSFLKEDLHRFLAENQLEQILHSFPLTFCSEEIWKYFDKDETLSRFQLTVCGLNLTELENEFQREFVDYAGNPWSMPNRSLATHLGGILESGGCSVDTALVVDWDRILDPYSADFVGDFLRRLPEIAQLLNQKSTDEW